MAHPVINIPPRSKEEKPKTRIVERIVTVYKGITGGIFDCIYLLLVSSLYFFFTGIAVARGKPIPEPWMNLGIKLDGGRLQKKLANVEETKPYKNRFKVVDLQNKATPIDGSIEP